MTGPASPVGEVERTIGGESVCGFQVAAYRETHPEHGSKYGHAYSEHWSTPNSRHPDVKVERLFTEEQLRAALSTPAQSGEVIGANPWEYEAADGPSEQRLRDQRALSPDTSKVGAVDVRPTLFREVDALGGTGLPSEGESWSRGYSEALSDVLSILSRRGFSEQADAALRASPPPVEAGMVEAERRGERRAIARVAAVAREIGWQAGVGGRETAGAIISYLVTSSDEVAPFVAGELSPLDFAGDWMRGGCLTWHGADGKVWSPEEAAAASEAKSAAPKGEGR